MSKEAPEAWRVLPAPAKLNLFLRITGRRDDGYHLLQTVFQLLDWGDSVCLRPRGDGELVRAGGDTGDISMAHDLSLRAARLLREHSGCSLGADIQVRKTIPRGGGFGGGSSDAATTLLGLNQLWNLGLAADELAALGLSLGADVPVFVRGRSAWAEGVGERLTPIDLPERHYLIVDPGVHVPTATLFQAPELTRDAPPATIADFVSGSALGNAFEPVVRRLQPAVDRVLETLSRFGVAQLTGSGSGCFIACGTRAEAAAIGRKLPAPWRTRVASGVSVSPLHLALAEFDGFE